MTLLVRENAEVDALVTDRYLESLLLAHDRRADDAPADLELDPAVRRTARLLSADLVRVHPSFRFEERLAARLTETATRMLAAAAASGTVAPADQTAALPLPIPVSFVPPGDPDADSLGDAWQSIPRPLIIGGAVTSAAISLAGAVLVAWRFGRPPLSPMVRALRAAQQARLVQQARVARPRLD